MFRCSFVLSLEFDTSIYLVIAFQKKKTFLFDLYSGRRYKQNVIWNLFAYHTKLASDLIQFVIHIYGFVLSLSYYCSKYLIKHFVWYPLCIINCFKQQKNTILLLHIYRPCSNALKTKNLYSRMRLLCEKEKKSFF